MDPPFLTDLWLKATVRCGTGAGRADGVYGAGTRSRVKAFQDHPRQDLQGSYDGKQFTAWTGNYGNPHHTTKVRDISRNALPACV
jgi:peptidoglycan hydrolase-like protein with peptidoglycan-binding domain